MHHILSMDLPLFFSKKTIYLNFQKFIFGIFSQSKTQFIQTSHADFLCRSCQIKVPMTSVILYQKLSPGHSYQHGCTAFFLPHAAATAAQAPVPQAKVSPQPRSQTRIHRCPASCIQTTSTFTPSGNISSFPITVPSCFNGNCIIASLLSTNSTQCGFPMDTQTGRNNKKRADMCSGTKSGVPIIHPD